MNSSDNSSEDAKLRTESLWVWYRSFPALRGISLSFLRQSVTSLIGPSGCGKTTLLRALNRTLENDPDMRMRGGVFLDGDNIYQPQMEVMELRRRVALVAQEAVPFPLSIFENIAYGPRLCGVRNRDKIAEIVEDALRRAAIWDEVQHRLEAPANQLSGGQQRRLCIARSLATNPEVLLLDEPGAMLDPTATSRIEDLICHLKQHYCLIVVTHNVHQAARISDHTAFLAAGELIEFGATAQLFTRPSDERTDDYLSGRLKGP
jgi:phosphate transport system ATP-binding protein